MAFNDLAICFISWGKLCEWIKNSIAPLHADYQDNVCLMLQDASSMSWQSLFLLSPASENIFHFEQRSIFWDWHQ